MSKKVRYIIGSVSSATMRPEDLIPRFLSAIQHFSKRKAAKLRRELREIQSLKDEEDRLDQGAYFLNETLFDTLNNYAPPYFYFGSHPGDGADYGFWLSEESLEEFDGVRVSDLSEVPRGYAGEVLLVNDHGNTSLYVACRGKLRPVWELV